MNIFENTLQTLLLKVSQNIMLITTTLTGSLPLLLLMTIHLK